MGRYPVTFREWDSAAHLGACDGYLPNDEGWGRGERPVINVNWDHAQAYVRFLNEHTGKSYRLPSEAEWEYCCRAGTTTAYSFGDNLTSRKQGVVFAYNRTVPVYGLWANRWGLVSMHGNVWEWCQDVWNFYYDPDRPDDGSPWLTGRGEQVIKVVRGGCWADEPMDVRSASRKPAQKTDKGIQVGDIDKLHFPSIDRPYSFGFRVSRTI
jgi:formylglycine-generating enzyme required for sulfatase activity